MTKNHSIFKKWWFWVLIIFALLSFTLFKDYIFPQKCQTYTFQSIEEKESWIKQYGNWYEYQNGASYPNRASNCPDQYVCINPKCNRGAGECSESFLAESGTKDNPSSGVCRPSAGFPF